MSKIAKMPVNLPASNTIEINEGLVKIKGPHGELSQVVHEDVVINFDQDSRKLSFVPKDINNQKSWAHAGTARANINNVVHGVNHGFKISLDLVGVGYRAQVQGSKLTLSLGFSHPIEFHAPQGVKIETPSNTNIILQSANKQLLGQVASNIREFRKPEPYKGKGIIRNGERVARKEAKKK
jgi:large subunit ribosomal protein L6